MKEKTFYKTPSVRVRVLDFENAILGGSNENLGKPGEAGGTGNYNQVDGTF